MSRNTYDYPIYLFNEGTNYNAYKFFKPAYVVKERRKMWRFRVWAPNAKSVSIVGNFNNWDRSLNKMFPIGKSGIWEGYARGLKRYDIYKYSIETQDGRILLKGDPFALHAETPPHTASKIYDIRGYKWSDKEYMEQRKTRDHYKSPMNIYEVHLGSWRRYNDDNFYSYRKIADELIPYIKDMGYTHIEILPLPSILLTALGVIRQRVVHPTSRYGLPMILCI